MKRDALENIVKNAMTDVEVALNTDEIWRGVEKKLYPKKKKRFGWFFFGLAFVAVLTTAWIFLNSQSPTPAIVDHLSPIEINSSTMSLNSDSASDNEAESQLSDEDNISDIDDTTTPNKEIKSTVKGSQSKEVALVNTVEIPTQKSSSFHKNELNDYSNNTTSTLPFVHQNKLEKVMEENTDNNFTEKEIIKARDEIILPILLTNSSNLSFMNSSLLTLELPSLDLPTRSLIHSEEVVRINKSIASLWAWHVDLSIGIDKPFRSISGNNENYISLRNESEKVLEGWRTQLLTGLTHQSGFYTSFGLSISNITERIDVDTKRTEYRMEDNPTIDKNKNGQLSIGTSKEKNKYRISDRGTAFSTHTFYSIPLSIGYQFDVKKWTFAGEMGTAINVLKQSKGYQLNYRNELVAYNTLEGNDDIFLKHVGLNLNTQFKFAYNFRKNQQFYIAPYILLTNQSITLDSYQLEQRYQRYGISMGYHYTFKK